MRLAVAVEFVTKRGAHCSLACRKLRFGELQSLLALVEDYAEPQLLGGNKRDATRWMWWANGLSFRRALTMMMMSE